MTVLHNKQTGRIFPKYGLIFIIIAYIIATFLVFLIGPIEWKTSTRELLLVSLLIFGSLASIGIGYHVHIKRHKKEFNASIVTLDGSVNPGRIMIWIIIISATINILSIWGKLLLMYSPFLDLWECIKNPGLGYVLGQKLQVLSEQGSVPEVISQYSIIFRLITLLSGVSIINIPLGFLCWKRIKLLIKILYIISIASLMIFYWIIGTNMGFGILLSVMIPILLYKAISVQGKDREGKYNRNCFVGLFQYWKVIVQGFCLLVGFILIFSFMQITRANAHTILNSSELDPIDSSNAIGSNAGADVSDTIETPNVEKIFNSSVQYRIRYEEEFKQLPPNLSYGILALSHYVGHGYKGLSSSMTIPFQWTYGLGWSYGLLQLSEKYLHIDGVWERTYLYRNEQINGWPALSYWSTIFPWLASDVSYYGVPILMFFLGIFLAMVWKNVIVDRNLMAVVLVGQLFQLFIMFPANNQLFNTISGFFSNSLVIILYFCSRTRFFKRLDSNSGKQYEELKGAPDYD